MRAQSIRARLLAAAALWLSLALIAAWLAIGALLRGFVEDRFDAELSAAAETLIAYPMDRARLDAFTHFLDPAGVQPAAVREIELTDVILLLVASGRGVAVLPDWVLAREAGNPDLVTLPLGRRGVTRRLYAAIRAEDRALPYMQEMLQLARAVRGTPVPAAH